MADVLSKLLDERDAIAATLADWRKRWDAAVLSERGSAEHAMAGLRPLDEYAFDLAYPADQASPREGRLRLNIGALPVIEGELVYRIAQGSVETVSAVYDRGYPLTATWDHATPMLLRAAKIAPGSYATCRVYGLIRLGAKPDGVVTADASGDNLNTPILIHRVDLAAGVDAQRRADLVRHAALSEEARVEDRLIEICDGITSLTEAIRSFHREADEWHREEQRARLQSAPHQSPVAA